MTGNIASAIGNIAGGGMGGAADSAKGLFNNVKSLASEAKESVSNLFK
jgi:hypothetical protein